MKNKKTSKWQFYYYRVKLFQAKKITLVNIYGPNEDKPNFYDNLQQSVIEFNNEHIIYCGDWNLVLDHSLDTENYRNINNPRARENVLKLIEENEYIDVWRVLNENKTKYTWRRLNPVKKQARLDFFIVSEDIFQFVTESSIVSGYRTHNSGITLKIKFQDAECGRGYWKFNNSTER